MSDGHRRLFTFFLCSHSTALPQTELTPVKQFITRNNEGGGGKRGEWGDPSGGSFIACVVMSSLKFLKLWDLLKRGELAYFSLPLPLTTVGILRLFLWLLGRSEGDQRGRNQERPSNGLLAGMFASNLLRDVWVSTFFFNLQLQFAANLFYSL